MYHQRSRRAGSDSPFTPLGAVALLLAGMATLIVVGASTRELEVNALWGLAFGELGILLVPVVATLHARVPLRTLGIARPRPVYVLAAALVGVSLWFVNWQLVDLLPLPDKRAGVFDQMAEEPPALVSVFVMAAVPAICEEVMFRGAVVRAFASRWSVTWSVVVSAALFSAYHVSLLQAIPTFTLGLVLGATALRSGSIVPTIVAHFLNNTCAVLVMRDPDLRDWLVDNLAFTMSLAAALTTVGLAMIAAPTVEPVVARARARVRTDKAKELR